MKEPIIEFKDFTFQYFSQAEPTLHHIDLTIYKGEKVLIVGPSGSGKSTLGHCINGLIPFSYRGEITGSVTVGGLDTKEAGIFALSRKVGTVLQDSDGQFVGLSVGEDIAFSLENDCVPQAEMKKTVREVADLMDMGQLLKSSPYELSGGQKQRVAFAGVMVNQVETLLFDEPLANLDPATGKVAIDLIDRIAREYNKTVVIIEHRLEDVLYRRVDRIIVMSDGRVAADMTPDDLMAAGILPQLGIREPLYVTALKYAGITPTPDMHPASLPQLALTPEQKAQVRAWFSRQPSPAGREEAPVLLEAKNIDFTYEGGHHALKGIDLTIRRGEMLSIVGTNGAGKSTFSKVICGFEQPQKGSLTLEGADLTALSIKERADRIGYVMQNPNQMISKNMIFDEVALGLRNREVPEEEIRPRVEQALKICGLYPFRNWPVSALSYGQKKRVTIASILVLRPDIILLDEPTAGQDFRHYTEIMEFLRELNRQGVTIVLITHDMHLMLEYTPRAVVFHDGEVICDASAAQVLNAPDIVERAHLKETSLYHLAMQCGIDAPEEFTRRFIARDQEVRK